MPWMLRRCIRRIKKMIMSKMESLLKVVKEINYILNLDYSDLVKFVDLKKTLKKGETVKIGESYNNCIYNELDRIKIITTIPPNGLFNIHWHDCKEKIKVVKGVYQNSVTGTTHTEGEEIEYKRYEMHQPFNPSYTDETILEVTFSLLN